MADWEVLAGGRPTELAGKNPDAPPQFKLAADGNTRTVTAGWLRIALVPAAGAPVDVYESCNKCSQHVHQPGDADDHKPTVVQDKDGKQSTPGNQYDQGKDGSLKPRTLRWHVGDAEYGTHGGKLDPGRAEP